MWRVIWVFVLAAACTTEADVQPDANNATPQSIVAEQIGLPHLGMKMTPKIRSCRKSCWAATPFGACAKQRDACLKTAGTDDARHECRKSSYACGQARRSCMQGCWADDPTISPINRSELVTAKPHLGMTMTPVVRECRQACWKQIPFDECAKQRDTCLATASTKSDRRNCKRMSLTCRNMRTGCLRGCWGGLQPDENPLGAPPQQIEQTDAE
jgi:hypothetical protein